MLALLVALGDRMSSLRTRTVLALTGLYSAAALFIPLQHLHPLHHQLPSPYTSLKRWIAPSRETVRRIPRRQEMQAPRYRWRCREDQTSSFVTEQEIFFLPWTMLRARRLSGNNPVAAFLS